MHSKLSHILSAATFTTLVLATQPGSADQYAEGAAAYSAGDFAGAKTHLLKAAQAKPKSWQTHYQLANTYVQLKDSAAAKASYLKCLASRPPADIKAHCTTALSYIASNPKLTAPVAVAAPRPVQVVTPKQPVDTTDSTAGGDSGEPAVSADLAMRRARIIQDGETEVARMKAQEKERQADAESNANQRYIYPDGTVKTSMSSEELAQMQREVEQKATAIRDRAKRKASDLK
ncbi:hypothetical protein BH10CYA1_BH10CYA1_01680 [soil metagenome]